MLKRIIRWLLAIVTFVIIITGLGITEFRTIEAITFGAFNKVIAFKIHFYLWIPFLVLLVTHIVYSPIRRLLKKRKKNN